MGRLLAFLACLAAAMSMSSCATVPRSICRYPADVSYVGELDSLGLDAFRRLDAPSQSRRRNLAGEWLKRASSAAVASQQLRFLRTAAGLAPDSPEVWLRVADVCRWLGDRASAQSSLDAAAAALRHGAEPKNRARLSLRLALARGWLHWDRGEWAWGLTWADSASRISPTERETMLLRGLLLGASGDLTHALLVAREIDRLDPHLSDRSWIRGIAAYGQRRLADAYLYFNGVSPDRLHRADFWNDVGLVCELLGNLPDARFYYRKAIRSLPVRDSACLEQFALPISPTLDAVTGTLPVMIAYDRYYVMGSPMAFALEAVRRFESAAAATERIRWGDTAINALGICLRRGFDDAVVRGLRGRVYVQMQAFDLAETDLRRARATLTGRGQVDAGTLYWSGHLKVLTERYAEALPLLRAAVAADSTRGAAWSSLGYALIMSGDLVAARAALDRTLALDPLSAAAWYNRGLMHFNDGQWESAVLDLRQAADLAPDNAEIESLLRRATLKLQAARREGAARP